MCFQKPACHVLWIVCCELCNCMFWFFADISATKHQISSKQIHFFFIFLLAKTPERSNVLKSKASLGWISVQAIMTAAFRHAQTGEQTSKLLLDTLLPLTAAFCKDLTWQKKRSCLKCHAHMLSAMQMRSPGRSRRAAVGSGTCYCVSSPVLSSSVPPSIPPSLPTVLSYLLLSSSSSCCHSVTLHLLTPLSLPLSPRLSLPLRALSPLATTSWKMRGNYLVCQLRFFSPLSVLMHSASALRRPLALFSLATLWF